MSDLQTVPEELTDARPSMKLIWMALTDVDESDPVTALTLAEQLHLSRGTVYPALNELEDRGLIESQWAVESPTATLYYR